MIDFPTKKKYFNLCNPREALNPDDPRAVEVGAEIRGLDWAEFLGNRVELATEPQLLLFTGLPGSGKSTELRRLAERLRKDDGARLLPVLIDAEERLDINSPIDVPDILVSIVYETECALLREEGQSREAAESQALRQGYLTRFWNWLTTTDVELKKVDVGAKFAGVEGKAALEFKTNPTFRQRLRSTVDENLSTFLAHVHQELAGFNERARARGFEGLIVILDSLEKLRGTSSSWTQVLASAEKLFSGGAPYLRLPVHVLYTLPPALVFRVALQALFIPMIKIRTKEGHPCPEGMAVARKIVTHRVPDAILEKMFGPLFESRIQRLIEWSGGYPREIIRLLQAAISEAPKDGTLGESHFEKLLSMAGDSYLRTVPVDAFPFLARVSKAKELGIEQDPVKRETADLMLSNNVVLRYMNQSEWFDLHPALQASSDLRNAVKQLGVAPPASAE